MKIRTLFSTGLAVWMVDVIGVDVACKVWMACFNMVFSQSGFEMSCGIVAPGIYEGVVSAILVVSDLLSRDDTSLR